MKVLYEIQYGKMRSYSHGIDSIVSAWMNKYYTITLTNEEKQLTYEAIQGLKNSGLIVRDATQRDEVFQLLTSKGKEVVEKQKDPDIYSIPLERIVANSELLARCRFPVWNI